MLQHGSVRKRASEKEKEREREGKGGRGREGGREEGKKGRGRGEERGDRGERVCVCKSWNKNLSFMIRV